MSELQIIIAVFAVYLLATVLIAAWCSRESGSVGGYFIAGKKLPHWVVAVSMNATGESGWLILGLTGMGYAVGIHALWVVLGEITGVAASWWLLARRIKRATDQYGSITIPDYLESRFSDTRHVLRVISAAIIVLMVATYIGAQLVATGKAFSQFMNLPYGWGVVIGAAITLTYTSVGGYKAVSYTDVFQGLWMLFGLLLLPVVAISAAGGWSAVTVDLSRSDPALLQWLGARGLSLPGVIAAASFVAIGLPFLGVPQLIVRYISIRDEAEIRTASIISVFCITCFSTGAVLTGIAGRALFPGLTDPEFIMPTVSRELFPPVLTGILVVVLFAAIMSTVSALLILASSAVTRDVVQRILRPDLPDHAVARLGQLVTAVIGVAGIFIALSESRVIFWFVLFSWSGLGATFGPVLLCSLYWRGTTLAGAAAGMLGGFLTTLLWVLFAKEATYNLYEVIPAFFVSLLLIVVVSRMTERPEK